MFSLFLSHLISMDLTRLRFDCQVWSMFKNWACASCSVLAPPPLGLPQPSLLFYMEHCMLSRCGLLNVSVNEWKGVSLQVTRAYLKACSCVDCSQNAEITHAANFMFWVCKSCHVEKLDIDQLLSACLPCLETFYKTYLCNSKNLFSACLLKVICMLCIILRFIFSFTPHPHAQRDLNNNWFCPFLSLSVCQSISLSVCQSVSPSVRQSVSLSVCQVKSAHSWIKQLLFAIV